MSNRRGKKTKQYHNQTSSTGAGFGLLADSEKEIGGGFSYLCERKYIESLLLHEQHTHDLTGSKLMPWIFLFHSNHI